MHRLFSAQDRQNFARFFTIKSFHETIQPITDFFYHFCSFVMLKTAEKFETRFANLTKKKRVSNVSAVFQHGGKIFY